MNFLTISRWIIIQVLTPPFLLTINNRSIRFWVVQRALLNPHASLKSGIFCIPLLKMGINKWSIRFLVLQRALVESPRSTQKRHTRFAPFESTVLMQHAKNGSLKGPDKKMQVWKGPVYRNFTYSQDDK